MLNVPRVIRQLVIIQLTGTAIENDQIKELENKLEWKLVRTEQNKNKTGFWKEQ